MRSTSSWRVVYAAPIALFLSTATIASAQSAAKPAKQMSAADLKAWKSFEIPCCPTTASGSRTSSRPMRATRTSSCARLCRRQRDQIPDRRRAAPAVAAGPWRPVSGGANATARDQRRLEMGRVHGLSDAAGEWPRSRSRRPGRWCARRRSQWRRDANGSRAEQDRAREPRHGREERIRSRSPLRVQWRQADRGSRCKAIPSAAPATQALRTGGRARAVQRRGRTRHGSRPLQPRDGEAMNVGNVAEFGFDDSGDCLAYTIDARDQIGNGVQLRNMKTDVVRAIDSDRALYRRLAWADSSPALAVLRGKVDSTAHDTLFSRRRVHEHRAPHAEEDRLRSARSIRTSRPA